MAERLKTYSKFPPLLLLPALGWFFWFLLIPLVIVGTYSLSTKGTYGGVVFHFHGENFLRATDWLYLRIFWNSLKLAFLTTFFCFLIGYPMAYVMATASPRLRTALLILTVTPFWTNFVIRAYATKILWSEYGPMNHLALTLRIIQSPFLFTQGDFPVWLGMVTNYLPFMVLPLYVSLEKFDFSLMEVARDLGASSWKILWEVLIPLTRPGIATGVIFVFTPAMGEFVIPDLLGGGRTMLIGNLITDEFLKARDWPFGAALSVLLLVFVMMSLLIYLRFEASEEEFQ